MKKLVLILVVLSLIGCSMGNDPVIESPFEGTWRRYGMNSNFEIYDDSLVFSGSNFLFTYDRPDDKKGTFSGPFSYTKTTITFNPNEGIDEDDEGLIPWTQNYVIYIDELNQVVLDIEFKPIVEGESFYLLYGVFIKQ